MMEGINVLNIEEIREISLWCLVIATCLIVFGIVLMIISMIFERFTHCLFISGMIIFISGFLFGIFVPEYKTFSILKGIQYEVLIDRTVSMVDFNNRYEIIEQRGAIYTIREKKEK